MNKSDEPVKLCRFTASNLKKPDSLKQPETNHVFLMCVYSLMDWIFAFVCYLNYLFIW